MVFVRGVHGELRINLNNLYMEEDYEMSADCEIWLSEETEEGQLHFCKGCSRRINRTKCEAFAGMCEKCSWLIDN